MSPPVERIEFSLDRQGLVGHLALPSTPGPHAAVVVAGPMTSVKEQVTGVYARAMADRGIAALAIDHRGFGESAGVPGQFECVAYKIDDLRAALSYLRQRPDIYCERLGLLAVCLGAGYAAWVAADNTTVKAIATVTGYYRNPLAMRAADPAGFQARIDQGIAARLHYQQTHEVWEIPAAAARGDAAMSTADTVDYYTRRALHPNYRNAFALMSREHFLPFDVQAAAPRICAPARMVHAENALSPSWARQFFSGLRGVNDLHWVESQGPNPKDRRISTTTRR